MEIDSEIEILKQKIKELEIKKRLNEKKHLTKEELEKTSLTNSNIQDCKVCNSDNEVISNDISYRGIFVKILKAGTSRDAIILLTNTEPGKHTTKGFNYIEELQISFQGRDSNGTMKDILTLVEANGYSINITIKLEDNTFIYYENS